MTSYSKPLGKCDESATKFTQEIAEDKPTFGFNIDCIYWDNTEDRYVLVELLKCEEEQWEKHGVQPWTSDPNKYFKLNWRKFRSQWAFANAMNPPAKLLLINYAELGTKYGDNVKVMEVSSVRFGEADPVKFTGQQLFSREEFKEYFKELNKRSDRDLAKLDLP